MLGKMLLCMAALAAGMLGACDRVASLESRFAAEPTHCGLTTMPDAWRTFRWACGTKDAATIRDCLTGKALEEFEADVARDEPATLTNLRATFAATDCQFDTSVKRYESDLGTGYRLEIRDLHNGQKIQTGTVYFKNVETSNFKLPEYKVASFQWSR